MHDLNLEKIYTFYIFKSFSSLQITFSFVTFVRNFHSSRGLYSTLSGLNVLNLFPFISRRNCNRIILPEFKLHGFRFSRQIFLPFSLSIFFRKIFQPSFFFMYLFSSAIFHLWLLSFGFSFLKLYVGFEAFTFLDTLLSFFFSISFRKKYFLQFLVSICLHVICIIFLLSSTSRRRLLYSSLRSYHSPGLFHRIYLNINFITSSIAMNAEL